MRTFIAILFLGLSFFWGCFDESSIISPPISESNQKSKPNWITLPQKSGLSAETEYTVTGVIDGAAGGKLEIIETYAAGPQSVVRLNAVLKFPKNCFQGTQTITMSLDNVNGTVTYSPSMNFDIPAMLDLQFQGIDLTGINPDSVSFVYHNPDGYFDTIEYRRLQVNIQTGTLILVDGKIPHFSRYGYSR